MAEIELGEYAFWIAVIVAAGVIITSWKSIDSARENRKLRFAEMLERTEEKLKKIFDEITDSKDNVQTDRSIAEFLNILDRLAFLEHKKKINHNLVYFFKNYFRVGNTIYEIMKENNEEVGGSWEDMEKWLKQNKIIKWPEDLMPLKIQELVKAVRESRS